MKSMFLVLVGCKAVGFPDLHNFIVQKLTFSMTKKQSELVFECFIVGCCNVNYF